MKLWPVSSSRTRDTTMLGEVPICVISPPSSEPKAIGIRKIEADTPERRANWNAIGIMIASAPMFLTKAESTRHDRDEQQELHPDAAARSGARRCIAASMIPERATPALTRSADPTMMTISSLKPEKASVGGTTPSGERKEQGADRARGRSGSGPRRRRPSSAR